MHKFHWIRVGDGNPEPAAVKIVGGKRMAFTIGCPDGFEIDGDSVVLVGEEIEAPYEMLAAAQQKAALKAEARREKRFQEISHQHMYAGFGR